MKDIKGQRFGKLVVLSLAGKDKRQECRWLCQCDCGNQKVVYGGHLRSGKIVSCGCVMRATALTHGLSKTKLYHVWSGMRRRCDEKTGHPRYGGRGIKICKEWNDFKAFSEWALANGYDENLTIDRIDNDGNYEPQNCRWVTMKEQANNTSQNHNVTIKGVTRTVSEWAEINSIPLKTVYTRTKRGMSFEDALTKPIIGKGNQRYSFTYKGKTKTLVEWSDSFDIDYRTLLWRIKNGWDINKALETPIRKATV